MKQSNQDLDDDDDDELIKQSNQIRFLDSGLIIADISTVFEPKMMRMMKHIWFQNEKK